MNERRSGLHGRQRVEDRWQVFIFDVDQVTGLRGGLLGFRHKDGNLISNKTNYIRRYPDPFFPLPPFHPPISALRNGGTEGGESRPAQYRLVVPLQAILIDRHIFRRENCDHARRGLGLRGVNLYYAGMRPSGEKDLHVQHAWHRKVAGILGFAGDLAGRVNAGKGLADQ